MTDGERTVKFRKHLRFDHDDAAIWVETSIEDVEHASAFAVIAVTIRGPDDYADDPKADEVSLWLAPAKVRDIISLLTSAIEALPEPFRDQGDT